VSSTWRYLAGDTSVFALDLRLESDEDDGSMVDADEQASWGAFSLWVEGRNLCLHVEQGEMLTSVHWYLLSLLEWIVEAWDPLLHEERLPLDRLDATDAAKAAARAVRRTIRPDGATDWDLDTRMWDWRQRHSLRVASSGGLFPDVWLRRVRDMLEVSVGQEVDPGTPEHFDFTVADRSFLVPVDEAAEALADAVEALARRLLSRRPESDRLKHLVASAEAISEGNQRRHTRLAWLSGFTPNSDIFEELWEEVEKVYADAGPKERAEGLGADRESQLVLVEAQVALLFGSLSPTLGREDYAALAGLVLESSRSEELDVGWGVGSAHTGAGEGRSPGEVGSDLGEDAYWELAHGKHDQGGYVDVLAVLAELRVQVTGAALSDPELRGLSLVAPGRAPVIVVNGRYKHQSTAVQRFTLAHELGHLVRDRERASTLAIGSGQWTSLDVEQRANAFAAALLMPRPLVQAALAAQSGPPSDPAVAVLLAGRLRVSLSSLADRLYNLQYLTRDEADNVKGRRRE